MKLRRFDELTTSLLDPLLVSKSGFKFAKGTYHRTLPSLLSHLVIIDIDTRSHETFRVICGLNSAVLTGGDSGHKVGVYCSHHLTKGGLQLSGRNWNCRNDIEATKSLGAVAESIERFALPWFNMHQTLASFAAEMADDQDYLKGQLYLSEGNIGHARANFEHYLRRLETMPTTHEVDAAKKDVQRLLQQL